MTENTGRAVMDDAQVIDVLRAVGRDGGPPLRDDPERALAAGRRARRRRRAFGAAASAIALAGVAALSIVMAQAGSDGRQIVLPPASSGTGIEQTSGSSEQYETNQQALQTALGDDFVINQSVEFPQGNVTVRPGSPAAEGLPTGYAVGVSTLGAGKGGADKLAQDCAPMVEKGLVVDACTERILPNGQIVYEQRSRSQPDPANNWVYDSVRVFFARPNGDLVIVNLWAWDSDSSSTPQRRAEAQAWLDDISPRLANAVTDPSVGVVDKPG